MASKVMLILSSSSATNHLPQVGTRHSPLVRYSSRPRAALLAMQLIRPTVWGPGLVTSLKGAGSTQPLSSFWPQQNFEQFLAAKKFLSLLWLVGLCCQLQPPHVTGSSSPAVAVKFLSPRLLFVDFIPLLYYFPLSSPLLGTRFLQQQQQQKAVEKRSFFWLSRAFFSGSGRCAPPARHLSSGERRGAQLLLLC